MVPDPNGIEPLYITMTGERARKTKPTRLFDDMPKDLRDYARAYIEGEGFTVNELRRRASARAALNISFFQRMSDAIGGKFVLATAKCVNVSAMRLRRHQEFRLLSFANL
jgi:hypothetical protein